MTTLPILALSVRRPIRIQRSRAKGWKMPPNTVYVGRGTKWGNPYRVGQRGELMWLPMTDDDLLRFDVSKRPVTIGGQTLMARPLPPNTIRHFQAPLTVDDVIRMYRQRLLDRKDLDPSELRGRDLCCWCQLGRPCHADVLLEIANQEVV